jgi:hypothetical protein
MKCPYNIPVELMLVVPSLYSRLSGGVRVAVYFRLDSAMCGCGFNLKISAYFLFEFQRGSARLLR